MRQTFSDTSLADGTADPAPPRGGRARVAVHRDTLVTQRDTEQAHLVLGVPTFGRGDDRRFALGVLDHILGGGMSSRLFQVVREERGLAYAVYSATSLFADSGLFTVYAGCAPGKAGEVAELVRSEVAAVARDGVSEREVERGKGMLQGSMVLDLEDNGARMSRLGKGELLHEQLLSVDELRARVGRVTRDEVNEVAQLLAGPLSLAAIGPVDHNELGPG